MTSSWIQPEAPSTRSMRSRRTNASWVAKVGMPRSDVAGTAVALLDDPVEARHAVIALDAFALEHDVVAGFSVVVGVAAVAVHHVVADDPGVEEQFGVLAGQRVEVSAAFQPVVTLIAHDEVDAVAAAHEVRAEAAERVLAVRTGDDEVACRHCRRSAPCPNRRG